MTFGCALYNWATIKSNFHKKRRLQRIKRIHRAWSCRNAYARVRALWLRLSERTGYGLNGGFDESGLPPCWLFLLYFCELFLRIICLTEGTYQSYVSRPFSKSEIYRQLNLYSITNACYFGVSRIYGFKRFVFTPEGVAAKTLEKKNIICKKKNLRCHDSTSLLTFSLQRIGLHFIFYQSLCYDPHISCSTVNIIMSIIFIFSHYRRLFISIVFKSLAAHKVSRREHYSCIKHDTETISVFPLVTL